MSSPFSCRSVLPWTTPAQWIRTVGSPIYGEPVVSASTHNSPTPGCTSFVIFPQIPLTTPLSPTSH